MNIRTMSRTDYPAVDRLMQIVHRLHLDARPDLFIPLEHPYSLEEYEEMISSDDMICILAEEDGQAAGICFVSIRHKMCMAKGVTAYLEDLCVDDAYQRRGIGQALYQQAEQLAKEKGASRIDLMVWEFNHKAMRFYQSLGLTPQRYILEKKL